MKWINDVVFAILAAHVWGSLMLFVWLQAVKKLSKRGYSRAPFLVITMCCSRVSFTIWILFAYSS